MIYTHKTREIELVNIYQNHDKSDEITFNVDL